MIQNLRWYHQLRNQDVNKWKTKKKKDSWLAKYSTILTCWCLQLINLWVSAPTILQCSANITWAGTPITSQEVLAWVKRCSIQWIRWQNNQCPRNSNNQKWLNPVINKYSKQLKKINQTIKIEWFFKMSLETLMTTTMTMMTRKAMCVVLSTPAENLTSLKALNLL